MGLRNWLYRMLDRGPELDPEQLIEIGRVMKVQVPMALAHLEASGYAAVAVDESHRSMYAWVMVHRRWAAGATEALDHFTRELS